MKCPQCGADNPTKNKFCGECGAPLAARATADRLSLIKQHIPESLVSKIMLTQDARAKERRNVTVIFTDITGFTSMAESMDSEELTLLMNECFRKLSMMVYRYEGIIDKFIGDCIMAIFGAPVSHEDDPERAILACLDMQSAIDEINAGLRSGMKRLSIHTGINTGEVIAGRIGSDLQMEYTVMGDTVNTAQRLKDVARPGVILVGPETFQRTHHAFDFLIQPPVQLKGKADTIAPYEVIGRKWGSEFGLGAVHADMVGRDAEIAELKTAQDKVRQGTSSVYVLKGEIGVGKSRLLYEFKKHLSLDAAQIALFEARGVSYESAIPYKSFGDALRRYFTSKAANGRQTTDRDLIHRIDESLGKDCDDIGPYLCRLLNLEMGEADKEKIVHLDSHSLQLQLHLAVSSMLETIAERTPIVFIVDDIQWADASSLDLLNFILPLVKNVRICFCLSYRIGDMSPLDTLLRTVHGDLANYLHVISLGNLGAADGLRMVNGLIGTSLSDRLKQTIVERSGGNPFFIEEIVRNLIESGTTARAEGLSESDIAIPGSIDTAVTSRIDSLNKEAKYLLKIAALIGRSFPRALFEEVVKETDVMKHADELEAAEFLVRINKDGKVFYAFRHPIFQEVVYNSLLKSERAIYHKIIAEAIETAFMPDFDGVNAVLAHHYGQCRNQEKTLFYATRAGDEAAALYANEEALGFYNAALAVTEDVVTRGRLLEKIADIEFATGNINDALTHYATAQGCITDRIDEARVKGKIARITVETGHIDEGIELMEQAIAGIAREPSSVVADMYYRLADMLVELKADSARAEELVSKGIAIARDLKDESSEASGLRMQAQILWRRNQGEQAMVILKQCQKLYERIGRQSELASLLMLMGAVTRVTKDLRHAMDYANQGLEIARKIGNLRFQALSYNNLGIYYDLLGDDEKALDHFERSMELRRRLGDRRGEGVSLYNIALLKARIAPYDIALDYLHRSRKIAEEIRDTRNLLTVYLAIGSNSLSAGLEQDAREYYEKALALAEERKDDVMLAETYYDYGSVLLELDERDRGWDFLNRARDIFGRTENKDRLTRFAITLADAYLRDKDPQALAWARKGLALATEVQMKHSELYGLRVLGKAQALLEGKPNEGIKNIKRSIALGHEAGMPKEEADSLITLAEVYIETGEPDSARAPLKQAREIFERYKGVAALKIIALLEAKAKKALAPSHLL